MLVQAVLVTLIGTALASDEAPTASIPEATNTSEFKLIVGRPTFVDKTLFIKEFMEQREMLVITSPPGFGKSTSLDMIRTFCTVTVDETGNREDRFSDNYKLFLQNNLDIYKHYGDFFNNHFGSNPVIYFDFKQLNCKNYATFIVSFRKIILNTFIEHTYLLHSERLNALEKSHIERFNHPDKVKGLEPTELYESVKELTRLLYVHFLRTECVILVDDYDKPMQQAILESGKDIGLIMHHIHEFTLATLKYNIYMGRGIITASMGLEGITATEEVFDVRHIPVIEHKTFSKFYGFTEKDVELLLAKHNLTDDHQDIKQFYYGYKVNDIGIYNPYSIVSYLAHRKIDNYWVKTSAMKNLKTLFTGVKVREVVGKLLEDGFVEVPFIAPLFIMNCVKLKEIMNNQESWYLNSLRPEDVQVLIRFMIDLGYFHVTRKYVANYTLVANITVSNREIENALVSAMQT